MAHMIGHNIGMGHDDGREECFCRDWHGCIMAQAIVGLDNVQPYKFSECSRSDYIDRLRTGNGICLLNKPNELEVNMLLNSVDLLLFSIAWHDNKISVTLIIKFATLKKFK